MVTRDYNYSRPLDVHRWSCYTETNTFVNSIYEQYFLTDKANKTIRKKLLKVVLLDLYVAWIDDPNLCIGVHIIVKLNSSILANSSKRSHCHILALQFY